MVGPDCGASQLLDGATVLSHYATEDENLYAHNIECRMTFRSESEDWKLMMRVVELDIPDMAYSELCNDALYVYDASNVMGRPVVSKILFETPYQQFCFLCSSQETMTR